LLIDAIMISLIAASNQIAKFMTTLGKRAKEVALNLRSSVFVKFHIEQHVLSVVIGEFDLVMGQLQLLRCRHCLLSFCVVIVPASMLPSPRSFASVKLINAKAGQSVLDGALEKAHR
jgi:hypothetical protein